MAIGETAQLVVDLRLNDQLSGGLTRAESQLGVLNATAAGSGGALGGLSGAMSKVSAVAVGVGGAMGHAAGQVKGLLTGPLGILGLTGGMLGLAGAAKTAIDSATGFQQSMEMIATQAGGTQAEVDAMTKAILAMATSVGTGPETLAAGLYHIESAGLRGAKALDILRIAAEGAKVGNADLESVTNAMIASVTSGIKGVEDMGGAMGSLNAIVGAGNMRMQDLTDAFASGILSSAKTFGVSLQSVGAALADMTNQGVPAVDAATRLRMTLSLLAAPTSQAAKEFERIGLGSLDLANAMRGPQGILGAIQMLADHMKKAGLIDANGNPNAAGADLLSKAFGGGRSSSAIMTLIGSVGKLADIQNQVVTGAGKFDDAWTKTMADASFKFEKFQAAIGTVAIRLGDALLPTLSDIADSMSTWLGDPANQQSLIGGLNAAIDAGKSFGGVVKDFILPPLKLLGDIIGAIPGPLKEAAAAGFIMNKSFGWLFGTSPLQLGRSVLGGLLGGLAGKVPGVGAVAGAVAGAIPVNVMNWPAGMGIPGAGGGGLPAAGAGAAGLGVAGLVGIAAGIAALVGLYKLGEANQAPGGANINVNALTGAAQGGRLPGAMSDIRPTQPRGPNDRDYVAQAQALARVIGSSGVALTAKDRESINHAANVGRDVIVAMNAGLTKLDPAKAIRAAEDIVRVYTSNTAANLKNIGANEAKLVALAAKFDALGDHVTAAKLRAAIAELKAVQTQQQVQQRNAVIAAQQNVAKTQAVHDRLARLNADENTNAARTRTAVLNQKPPIVNTSVNVHTSISVTDMAKTITRTTLSGSSSTFYGNRPAGRS